MVTTRFAPSPTGYLHVGNARTALVCWLYAKSQGGTFILRVDDTDLERSKKEYDEAIQEDLKWLGLEWDALYRQTDRIEKYEAAKRQLIESGRLYPCYESQEELEVKRKTQLNRGLPPIYDRAALKLTDADKQAFEDKNIAPHWRFKLEDKPIHWQDLVRGDTHFEGKHLSDPVLIRACGTPTYMLPSAVDDIDMQVTHVVRGEDHVSNTAIQVQLFEALGAQPPSFAHLALIKSKEAEISKRTGGFDIASLREQGIEPMAINSLFSRIGTSDPIEAIDSLDVLTEQFDISKFGRAPAHYDQEELERLNAKLLHAMPYSAAKSKLEGLGLKEMDEAFWNSIRGNINHIGEAKDWWDICKKPLEPVVEDAEFNAQASKLLPDGDWDEESWGVWVNAIKETTGRKGKNLFMPLRKALTASETGPELKQLFPLIGREKVLERLKGNAA